MNLKINFKNILIIFFALILLGLLAGAFVFWQRIYLPMEPGSAAEITFFVKSGERAKDIALNLEKQGIMKSSIAFRIYARFTGISGSLKAGDYLLSPGLNIPEIINKLVLGEVIKREITILEGWDFRDIASYIERQKIATSEDFLKSAGFGGLGTTAVVDSITQGISSLEDKPSGANLEGYLFPDTYEFLSTDNLEVIIKKILLNFDKKFIEKMRADIARQNKSIFEIVIMASLLEKEVKTLQDKKMVSGLLWKRIEIDMPLQVDSTVIYATGKRGVKVLISDTKTESPYNTYRNTGLPSGPISNPGLDSIMAAIYPEKSSYLYYLSEPGGQTIFSRTLEEHNIAKQKYLK